MKRSAMKNLSHGASFHPKDKIAPSKRGRLNAEISQRKSRPKAQIIVGQPAINAGFDFL